jgi:predicted amidophosphoribosyltransferase
VPGLDSFAAVAAYQGRGRDLVVGLKSRGRHAGLDAVGAALAEAAHGRPVDAVTWPPTTARRRRRRGFDQAELLARAAARHLGRPARSTLRRLGGPQAGRAASARWSGARFVGRGHQPGRLLLVDDVVTTGATLGHAAAALRSAGALEVHAVALARTPLKVVVPGAEDRGDGGLPATNG